MVAVTPTDTVTLPFMGIQMTTHENNGGTMPQTQTQTKKKTDDRTALQVWGIPAELKTKFKIACLRKGTTMRNAVLAFLKSYTNN